MGPRIAITVTRQYALQAVDRLFGRTPGSRWHRPWMKRRETALITALLRAISPLRCLEWGSGHSTLYFPRFMAAGGTWLSIEHDRAWNETIRGRLRDHRVKLVCVAPDRAPWGGPRDDGTYESFRSYVDYPVGHGPFDFVLVDGRARPACVERAASLLSPRGVVVLHDAHREIYRAAGAAYRFQERFTDYRDEIGGLWVGRIGGPVEEVLDVEHERALWSAYRDFGRSGPGRFLRV